MRTPPNERVSSDIAEAGTGVGKGRSRASGHRKTCAVKSTPERRCILTGQNAPQDELLRLAISPDGEVLPDPSAKAPGRGAWISLDRAVLEAAMANGQLKGALARAFKGAKLSYSEELPQQVESALRRALLDRLGLGLRSGQVVLGSGRIEDQARAGALSMLLHASDSSEDGRKKLDQAWRVGREAEGSGERGTVLPLDRAALSVALGRENVVHLALTGAGGADRVDRALRRFLAFSGPAKTSCESGEQRSNPADDSPHGDDTRECTKD